MKGLIFTYALTYGGAFASLFNPYYGLLIYVCFAIIKPESLWYWSVPQGNYSRIIAIALLVGWAINGFGSWKFGRAKGIVFALLGFWIWAGISALQAANEELAFTFLENMAKIVLPFLVGITLVDSVEKLKQLAWVIILSQGYVAFDLNVSYYEGFNRLQLVGFANMDNNSFAIGMVAGFGLAFFLGLLAKSWFPKTVAFGVAVLMAHCVMFSFSRGGMLALILTTVVAFFLMPKQPKHYAMFLVAVLIGVRLAGPQVMERFATTFADKKHRDASAQSRIDMWKDCIDVMTKHPVVGVGPDHWPLIAATYGWSDGKEAHTLWLQIGAELGIPGLLFLLGFYSLCVLRLWRFARERTAVPDPWLRTAARMVIASLVGFMIAAQFVSLEGLELPYYVTLIGAGALKLMSLPDGATNETPAVESYPHQMPVLSV